MNYELQMKKEWEKYQAEKESRLLPTVLLLGISGAGKSSLINTVFGKPIAKVSNVEPETIDVNVYKGHDYGKKVNLIDSAGYEMNEGNTFFDKFTSDIKDGIELSKEKPKEKIHIIWYCISILNERVEDMDIKLLKSLYSEESLKKRVCVVFTKCDEDDEEGSTAKNLKDVLYQEVGYRIPCFQTSNDPDLKLELDDLIKWSGNSLDDNDLRAAFISAQIVNLDAKKKEAEALILKYSAAASASTLIPIPGSDSVAIGGLQIKMIYDILDLYGIAELANIPMPVIVDMVISQLGKQVAMKIISFIPYVKVVNAGVAGTITNLLGRAISKICYEAANDHLSGKNVNWVNIIDSSVLDLAISAVKNDVKLDTK